MRIFAPTRIVFKFSFFLSSYIFFQFNFSWTTSQSLIPCSINTPLNSFRQLCHINGIRSENSKVKSSLLLLLERLFCFIDIRNNNENSWGFLSLFQYEHLGYLSLQWQMTMIVDLSYNIIFCWTLPKSLRFWFTCCQHETTRNIWLTTQTFIFKHQTYINFCIFLYFYSELRIVEPSVITFRLQMLIFEPFFGLSTFIKRNWTSSSICFGIPLTLYWVNFPVLGKYFVNSNLVELNQEISERHPPRSIWLFSSWSILHILLNCLVFFPIISFLTERTSPNSFISPRISQSNQF